MRFQTGEQPILEPTLLPEHFQIHLNLGDSILVNVEKSLSTINKTIWPLSNNQRGHPLKYQRVGSSIFFKVTGRTSIKCVICLDDIGNKYEKRCDISYIDQLIVSSIKFSIFEK